MKMNITNVDKSFGRLKALDGISLNVEEGTMHGLLGSNGAGKTTLMKILAGIYKPDKGEVLYDGNEIYENTSVKSDVIFIQDTPYFFGTANLNRMAEFYKGLYPNWSMKRYKQLTQHFKLNPKKPLGSMSKGMKRQAVFVLAIAARPKIMLLDEPFDGLDPIVRNQVRNILLQDIANHNMTVIASSHNLREMEDICDSVSIMHYGKLLFNRDLTELKGIHNKLQIAFKELPDDDFYDHVGAVQKKVRGRVITCIIKGDVSDIEDKVRQYEPLMYDVLPLTLEEIFTYEMGEKGYEISNIVVE